MRYQLLTFPLCLSLAACMMEDDPDPNEAAEEQGADDGDDEDDTDEDDTYDDGDAEDDDGGDDEADGSCDDDPAESLTLSGWARRTAPELGEGNDGIGVLYVAAFDDCALTAGLLGAAGVPMADLSGDGEVEFEIPGLAPGTVHLVVFLDDDLNADPMGPLPSAGDLVYADQVGDGVLSCVEVELVDEDVTDVELELNGVVPH